MLEEETKHIKVYVGDYDLLNQYLSLLQFTRKKRLSFADVVHEILQALDQSKIEEWNSEGLENLRRA